MALTLEAELRPASKQDWPLIRSWLGQPNVKKCWGPPAAAEAEIILALDSEYSITRIIEIEGTPIGYCHAVDAAIWGAVLPEDMPAGTWDLDVLIADPSYQNEHLQSQVLMELRREVFETTLAVAVSIFAPLDNEATVRAYEEIGFHWMSVWNNRARGPSWFLICGR